MPSEMSSEPLSLESAASRQGGVGPPVKRPFSVPTGSEMSIFLSLLESPRRNCACALTSRAAKNTAAAKQKAPASFRTMGPVSLLQAWKGSTRKRTLGDTVRKDGAGVSRSLEYWENSGTRNSGRQAHRTMKDA